MRPSVRMHASGLLAWLFKSDFRDLGLFIRSGVCIVASMMTFGHIQNFARAQGVLALGLSLLLTRL